MLPTEVRCIWQQRLSGATVAYVCVRYALFLERVVLLLELLWSSSDATCSVLTHADDALFVLDYLAVGALTAMRAYCICARDWRPLAIIVPLLLVNPVVVLVSRSHLT